MTWILYMLKVLGCASYIHTIVTGIKLNIAEARNQWFETRAAEYPLLPIARVRR